VRISHRHAERSEVKLVGCMCVLALLHGAHKHI
jgi:hypothetical protein